MYLARFSTKSSLRSRSVHVRRRSSILLFGTYLLSFARVSKVVVFRVQTQLREAAPGQHTKYAAQHKGWLRLSIWLTPRNQTCVEAFRCGSKPRHKSASVSHLAHTLLLINSLDSTLLFSTIITSQHFPSYHRYSVNYQDGEHHLLFIPLRSPPVEQR